MAGTMKSVFYTHTTVEHDGTDYRLDADVTMDGSPFYRVTNLDTDESGITRRDRDQRALLTTATTLTHDMEDALAQEVEVVIPKGYTRAQVGDGERDDEPDY